MKFGGANEFHGKIRAFGYVVLAGIYFYFAESHFCSRGQRPGERSVGSPHRTQRSALPAGDRLCRHGTGLEPSARTHSARWAWSSVPGGGGNLAWAPRWAGACWLRASCPWSLTGGLIITFWLVPRQFGILFIDLLLLAVAALAEEVAFRGYPFQRLIEAMGPTLATAGFLHCLCRFAYLQSQRQSRQLPDHGFQQLVAVDCLSTHPGALGLLGMALCLECKYVCSLRTAGKRHHRILARHSEQYRGSPLDYRRRLWPGSQRRDRRRAAHRNLHRLPRHPRICLPLHPTGHCSRRHPRQPGRDEQYPRSPSPGHSPARTGRRHTGPNRSPSPRHPRRLLCPYLPACRKPGRKPKSLPNRHQKSSDLLP